MDVVPADDVEPHGPSDLALGSYSDTPPWILDRPDELVWRQGIAEERARVEAELPALTAPAPAGTTGAQRRPPPRPRRGHLGAAGAALGRRVGPAVRHLPPLAPGGR